MRPLRRWVCALAAMGGMAALCGCGRGSAANNSAPAYAVEEGPFRVWTSYEGELAARRVVNISSQFNGPAVLTYVAPEGSKVNAGDIIVRFDSFQAENELARLEREVAVAEAEGESLERAVLPLELRELEIALDEAKYARGAARQSLADSLELEKEGLVSAQEVERDRLQSGTAESKVEQLEERIRLVQAHIHPARLEESRAKRAAAVRQRDLMREQVAQCAVAAPCDGEVVHLPLLFGTELRPAQVGDTVYKNQEFLSIPEPGAWVVRMFVPERELARVRPGLAARVMPRAWPDLDLPGVVEHVAAISNSRGSSAERVFAGTIRLEASPPELKSGLTVDVAVLSADAEKALLLPRAAVEWREGRPFCRVRTGRGIEERALVLGMANDRVFEVRSGLSAGEQVVP